MSTRFSAKIFLVVWLVVLATLGACMKNPTDNVESANVEPYAYGKTPPAELGAIKNPDNAYIYLKLRFRADSVDGHHYLFQTAPGFRGLHIAVERSFLAIIVQDVLVRSEPLILELTDELRTGEWYTLEVEALNGEFVRAALNGRVVGRHTAPGLSMDTSQLLVGNGFDAYGNMHEFHGQIDNISIAKGNRPSLAQNKNLVFLYLFYSALLIGILVFLTEFFLAKKKYVQCSAMRQREVAYTGIVTLLIGGGVIYYIYFLKVNGYLPSPFIYDKSNTFMDLYNTMYWAYDDGRYTSWRSVYPPLNFFILRLINFVFMGGLGEFVRANHAENIGASMQIASWMRTNSLSVIMGFCLIYLALPAIILRTRCWHDFPKAEKIMIYFAIVLSTPMLFTLERGNLILLAPVFLALVISKIGLVRSICIALLINIKPYFALLMIYYIARQNWKGFTICAALSGLIFAVSGWVLDRHFLEFFANMLNFSQASIVAVKAALGMPSSISVFSYTLKHAGGAILGLGSLSPESIKITVYLIETIKWCVLAISLFMLFMKSRLMRDAEIFSVLVVATSNLGISVGGYSLIFYIALIPVVTKMRAKWLYIGLISLMAIPLDIIPLVDTSIGEQYSYLSDAYINTRWTLGLGSVVRPIANFILLMLLSYELFARKHKASSSPIVNG